MFLKYLRLEKEQQKKRINGTGEMVQWLKAPAILLEDLGLVPSTHVTAHNLYTPVPGNLTPSTGLFRKSIHMMYTHLDKTSFHITQ